MPSWDRMMLVERPGAVRQSCQACSGPFWVPPSKAGVRRTCSPACASSLIESERAARVRQCVTCGSDFTPRRVQLTNGQGRFCSQQCNDTARTVLQASEVQARAADGLRLAIAEGRKVNLKGEHHPRWQGGAKGTLQRQIADGRSAAQLRKWRAANPDRAREQSQRRADRKVGRLPYGTVPLIRRLQKDRCAICRRALFGRGHLDHIVPLARGGSHAPANLQMLCARCNLTKSDRDPITHMQSLGRLI